MARTDERGGALRAICRSVRRRLTGRDDGGFMLLESMIAITVITIIMGAIGAEFVGAIASTNYQRAMQAAVQIGDSEAERARSLHASDLKLGRDATSVSQQFSNAPAVVQSWLSTMNQVSDAAAVYPSGATATLATSASASAPLTLQKPASITYTVLDYLGSCYIASHGAACQKSFASGAITYLRDVIAVTWTGPHCRPLCSYITSTLINSDPDQTFQVNQPLPAAPTLTDLSKTVAVGDVLDATTGVQLVVDNNTGVAPFTWQLTPTPPAPAGNSLPTNLAVSPTGLISGTVGGSAGTVTTKVDVTDAFLRSATMKITWTVEPPLVVTPVADQASIVNTVLSPSLTLTATGGDGAPYTWTAAGLPNGLSASTAGVVSGTPTRVGTYPVRVTVVDKGGTRSATGSFNWTISYPPVVAPTVTAKTSTANTAITDPPLSASGGDNTFVWADPTGSLPTGVTISSSGVLSGIPTTIKAYSVTLQVADPTAGSGPNYTKSVSFTWTVVAKPTVTAPAAQTSTLTGSVNLPLGTSCPNAPCSYALKGSPAGNVPGGLTVTNAGVITGTVSGAPGTFSGITIVVTDAAGATATSAPFTWTVFAKPTVTAPSAQSSTVGAPVSVGLTTTCPNSPCTYVLSGNAPAGLTVTNTGVITGPVTGSAGTYANITATVKDAGNVSVPSSTFTWTVNPALTITSPGNQSTAWNAAVNLLVPASGGTGTLSYSATGLPAGLSINSSTGRITGTTGSANTKSTVTVTVSEPSGYSQNTSFTWYITNLSLRISDQVGVKNTTISPMNLSTASYTTGGSTPYAYAISSGSLPAGLTLGAGGTISGTPTTNNAYTFTVKVTDNTGAWTTTQVKWTISAKPLTIGTITKTASTKNVADSLDVSSFVSGGNTAYTYALAGSALPPGTSLNTATGLISGTPTASGTFPGIKIKVTDSVGVTVTSAAFSWKVN
ncbi:MAG: putative Ig domain-containing protein [Jatrophihabitantaceae bacterium]